MEWRFRKIPTPEVDPRRTKRIRTAEGDFFAGGAIAVLEKLIDDPTRSVLSVLSSP